MNPQFDPRIIHTWQEDKQTTLCGLSAEELARWRYDPKPGTTVYQCQYCRAELMKRPPDA